MSNMKTNFLFHFAHFQRNYFFQLQHTVKTQEEEHRQVRAAFKKKGTRGEKKELSFTKVIDGNWK